MRLENLKIFLIVKWVSWHVIVDNDIDLADFLGQKLCVAQLLGL